MEKYNFNSIFKDEITNFINFKKGLGYLYGDKKIADYKVLDKFFVNINLKEKIIDNGIIEKWLGKSSDFSIYTKQKYYCIISMFTKYLVNFDYKNITIPTNNPYKTNYKFIPYIYTKREIDNIFEYISSMKSLYDRYYVLYICVCLFYCCGLRMSEVLNLKLFDFDVKKQKLLIRNGKNNVDRYIYLTDELSNLLIEYIDIKKVTNDNEYIFYPRIKRIGAANNIRHNFHATLKNIGINKRSNGYYPRVHDLRHTFAINALEQMQNKGFDLYTSIPLLSTYLGHKSIVETEYYLRFVPENFNRVIDANKHLSNLYGKDKYYEE